MPKKLKDKAFAKGRPKNGEQGTETTTYHGECTVGDMDAAAFEGLLDGVHFCTDLFDS
ncbi:MAG: hypothetical protein ACYCX4_00150 [Bacillota bacterium]